MHLLSLVVLYQPGSFLQTAQWLPRVLLRTKSLPLDKVLIAVISPTLTDDPFDFILLINVFINEHSTLKQHKSINLSISTMRTCWVFPIFLVLCKCVDGTLETNMLMTTWQQYQLLATFSIDYTFCCICFCRC